MTLKELAAAMGVKAKVLQHKLRSMGESVRGGMAAKLSPDACELAVLEYGMTPDVQAAPDMDIVAMALSDEEVSEIIIFPKTLYD